MRLIRGLPDGELTCQMQFLLGQRSHDAVASLLFSLKAYWGLAARSLCIAPVPGNPGEIASLNEPYSCVHGDEMAAGHGAEVEESVPVH